MRVDCDKFNIFLTKGARAIHRAMLFGNFLGRLITPDCAIYSPTFRISLSMIFAWLTIDWLAKAEIIGT